MKTWNVRAASSRRLLVSVVALAWALGSAGLACPHEPPRAELYNMSLADLVDIVVVTASRHEQSLSSSPRSVSVITGDDLRAKNYRTTPEALQEIVGVFVQETNYGGGAPIMRGLIGNQILILIDGIRLNNGTVRLGPNQYLNTIDISQVERIEVVRGSGSVLYGSDALGGLINIITKNHAGFSDDGSGTRVGLSAAGRYSSADQGRTARFECDVRRRRIAVSAGATLRRFADLTAGREVGLQRFTGYDEWAGDIVVSLTPADRHFIQAEYQHLNQSNVPRSDRLLAGSDIKREWIPQRRQLLYTRYAYEPRGSFIQQVQLTGSYQVQLEELASIASSSPGLQSNNRDRVSSLGGALQIESTISTRQSLTYGVDYYGDCVESSRTDVELATGATTPAAGTFADGSHYHSLGIFAQDEILVSKCLSLNLGLRYSAFKLKADIEDDEVGTVHVDNTPETVTPSAFMIVGLSDEIDIVVGVSSGFRAPNVDDATIIGSFGSGFEVPNPDLNPERSVDYEAGIRVHRDKLVANANFFWSELTDLIVRAPGTYDGLSFLDRNDNGIQDPGDDDVFQRQNLGRARIFGFEIDARLRVARGWTLKGNLTWTRGEDRETGDPLRRIPPLNGVVSLRRDVERSFWIEGYSLFATKQDRLAPGDISDPRIPDGGTPGFVTLNLRGGLVLGRQVRLTLGVENITNTAYRFHGSGIDAPGTNTVLGLECIL